MIFRLVPNSVTLDDLKRRNGRYNALFQVNEYGKRAFQLLTASSSIVLIDQGSTSITHIER